MNPDNLYYVLQIRKGVQSDDCPDKPEKFDIIPTEAVCC